MPDITPEMLTEDYIARLDIKELLKAALVSFELGEVEQILVHGFIKIRAAELNSERLITDTLSKCQKADKALEKRTQKPLAKRETVVPVEIDPKTNEPKPTIGNMRLIMENDPFYDGIQYNLLLNAPEISKNNVTRRWKDTDDARSREYIEKNYGIYNERKHDDALKQFFEEKAYHPVQEIVNALVWDGVPRIEKFLTKWAKAEDCKYTDEVSRLIFAGGIHRLYQPGCKFDDVPVLIGTSQGEGKSSLVRWLAIHDNYYSELKTIEGKEALEQIEGSWICEISELLALTKTKEQEAVKSFITCQNDKYRKPYGKHPEVFPRGCVFVGTTNKEHCLVDKTGNRRFYPVRAHSSGYELYDHEAECREYIIQCWAEAKVRYDKGEMPNYANRALTEEYRAAQENAMEDDWRLGAMEAFLEKLPLGEYVCIRQIKREALCANKDFPQDPTPKESQEIGIMMQRFSDWEKAGVKHTKDYGSQRCWVKVSGDPDSELPFDR